MWEEIIKRLLTPRTIIAFMFYGLFCILTFRFVSYGLTTSADKMNPVMLEILKFLIELLKAVILVLMGFYFGQKTKPKQEG